MPTRISTAAVTAHPIQVVARRTGLSVDVIRAWERRYGVVEPVRSDSGRRLYSDADIERLRLLARATLTGRTIGQVAGLSESELAALVREPGSARAEPNAGVGDAGGRAPDDSTLAHYHLRAALDAVERFDGMALDAALRRAVIALPAAGFLDAVVVPLWDLVAERTREGARRAPHQHLALTALRRTLHRIAEISITPLTAPDLVVSTPSGQPQDLGALLVAATAGAEGWRVTYVGPGLPADEIAETAVCARAHAVAVSLGTLAGNRGIPHELRRLRVLLPPAVSILVEGAGADAHRRVLHEIGAVVLRDLPALRARLRILWDS